jgi:hypothetical protein
VETPPDSEEESALERVTATIAGVWSAVTRGGSLRGGEEAAGEAGEGAADGDGGDDGGALSEDEEDDENVAGRGAREAEAEEDDEGLAALRAAGLDVGRRGGGRGAGASTSARGILTAAAAPILAACSPGEAPTSLRRAGGGALAARDIESDADGELAAARAATDAFVGMSLAERTAWLRSLLSDIGTSVGGSAQLLALYLASKSLPFLTNFFAAARARTTVALQ